MKNDSDPFEDRDCILAFVEYEEDLYQDYLSDPDHSEARHHALKMIGGENRLYRDFCDHHINMFYAFAINYYEEQKQEAAEKANDLRNDR